MSSHAPNRKRLIALTTIFAAILVASAPWSGVAHAKHVEETTQDLFTDHLLALVIAASNPLAGQPGTRLESDGSVTVLGFIEDDPGPMMRAAVNLHTITAALGSADPKRDGGIFLRKWQAHGETITTVGFYMVDYNTGDVTNVNVLALEGVADANQMILDIVSRDATPILLNILPFILNWAHPTSLVALVALALGALAVVLVLPALASLGFGDLAIVLMNAYFYVMLAPVFYLNVLYPYHVDPIQGEVYRDFPDTYVWRGIKRTPHAEVWDGVYVSRHGDYKEGIRSNGDGSSSLWATAWKRNVVGPVLRVDTDTTKLPGVYLRQDIERDYRLAENSERFDAESHLTVGAYHDAIGESPGVTVRFEEWKEGDQTLLYVPEQEDTISLGVTVDGEYVPLVGTRTNAWHRFFTDTTNLGASVSAIESYRLTSVGFYAPMPDANANLDHENYVPVAGFDYWGERFPTDLWALFFALGHGLGDQDAGDIQIRTGYFVLDNFVPVFGMRVDDDFEGHRYDYRTMVSAGLFVADPLDPGRPSPAGSGDKSTYVPLVAATYDGVQGSTPWALSNAADNPDGMGTFLVSAGLGGPDAYYPLVGAEYVPGAHEGKRRAQETYRVGIFPADYAHFIPLAGATWDGDQTSAAWVVRLAGGHAGLNAQEGEFDSKQGVYLDGETFTQLTMIEYRPKGSGNHAYGHEFTLGAYDENGAWVPLATLHLSFRGPLIEWAPTADGCDARADVDVHPVGERRSVVPPCVQ